ncbi:DnaB-like helicase C-terminal domain-containing protein [Brevibacillus laterosporus]|uniref:DnaB-like helicase C-terminal domain-containing protein n=1 Tax=Brevibacillus laterosporus TaxID=1465 RepID=UPI003D1B99DE
MPSIEELQLLNHVLATKSLDEVKDSGITEEHFPVHLEAYEFIKRFYTDHGKVPTLETVLNKFDTFEPVELENVDAVVDSLKEDWLHRKFKPTLVSAAQLVADKRTIDAIQNLKLETTTILKMVGADAKGYSYVKEADNRLQKYLAIHGRNENDILGIPTGFDPLDIATNGLESGNDAVDYFLVFAPTNMGKTLITSFMLQAGWNSTPKYDFPAYFALEQKASEIALNWDNVLGNVSRLALTRGTMSDEEKDKYVDFIDRIRAKQKDIVIYDMDSFGGKLPTTNDIRRILESEGHTRFALDQLSKVVLSHSFGDLRQQLFVVSREVRAMILETGIPGFIIAQANRDSARRVRKDTTSEVTGEDIGEAYAILQDASKGISIVKINDTIFRITVIKNRNNSSSQSFLVRYDFSTGLVHVLNEVIGEQYF